MSRMKKNKYYVLLLFVATSITNGWSQNQVHHIPTFEIPPHQPSPGQGLYNRNFPIDLKGPRADEYHNFTIVLKNDSIVTVKNLIHVEKDLDYITVKRRNKRIKIYPADTKELFWTQEETGKKVTGVPTDSCWLFKTAEGRINAYSPKAELGNSLIVAIQKGEDSPIIPITKDILMKMVEGNERAMFYVKVDWFDRAIDEFNRDYYK
jgi:hypothetical protein